MRALLFAPIAIWLPAVAAAQGVRGTVRDAQTGKPLNALWLDEKSGVPRFIDYEYVNLPFRVQSEHASGHVSVRQLPNGAFIIDAYRIVMPLLRQDAGTRLVRTDRIRIRSGKLLDVTLNGRRTRPCRGIPSAERFSTA